MEAIEDYATAFLDSEHAVLLVDRTGRTSPQFSTVDHLLLERRVLDLLDDLTQTAVDPIPPKIVEQAIAGEAPGLGATRPPPSERCARRDERCAR